MKEGLFYPSFDSEGTDHRRQIVTQRNRPARLENFHLLDRRSPANLVNIGRGRILRPGGSSPMPSSEFAQATCNDRRGYCRLSLKDFGSLVLISMLFVEREREIMPVKPPRAVMRVSDLFAKRGSKKEMSSNGAGSVAAKRSRRIKEPCGFCY